MSLLADGGYLDLSEKSLFSAQSVFESKHFDTFCEHTTSSVERLFRHFLFLSGECKDQQDLREKYNNHRINGMANDLLKYPDMLEEEDIESLRLCLAPLLPQDQSDGTFNKYKYPNIERPHKIWPKQWVSKDEAITMYKNVIPTIVKLLRQHSEIDLSLIIRIQQTLSALSVPVYRLEVLV